VEQDWLYHIEKMTSPSTIQCGLTQLATLPDKA